MFRLLLVLTKIQSSRKFRRRGLWICLGGRPTVKVVACLNWRS